MSENMARIQCYIDSELDGKLEELAHQLKMSKSEIIRQSIRNFLKMKKIDTEDPLLGIIGLGGSGINDIAENHDKYLTESALKPAEMTFRQGLKEAMAGETMPISELWDDVEIPKNDLR